MSPIPQSHDNTLWHIGCRPGDIGRVVILVQDPADVDRHAALLEQARFVAAHREFVTMTGRLQGLEVSIISVGLGGPCMAIAVEELKMAGAAALVYLGEMAPLPGSRGTDELVIPWAAVRDELTSQQYVPLPYPALADPDVAAALRRSARRQGHEPHMGLILSTDSCLRHSQAAQSPLATELQRLNEVCSRAGVLGMELAVSTLFVVSRTLGIHAGALLSVGADWPDVADAMFRVALGAVQELIDTPHDAPGAPLGGLDLHAINC